MVEVTTPAQALHIIEECRWIAPSTTGLIAMIEQDAQVSLQYAMDLCAWGRKNEITSAMEDAIASDAETAIDYALDILGGPFEKGSRVIMANKKLGEIYMSFLCDMGVASK